MLILSRKDGQEIVLNVPGLAEPVRVKVWRKWFAGRCEGVAVGITAPYAVEITRAELLAEEESAC